MRQKQQQDEKKKMNDLKNRKKNQNEEASNFEQNLWRLEDEESNSHYLFDFGFMGTDLNGNSLEKKPRESAPKNNPSTFSSKKMQKKKVTKSTENVFFAKKLRK